MLTADILEYEVPFQRIGLIGNRWTPQAATRTAFLLHGGGASAADGFLELRTFLYAQGNGRLCASAVMPNPSRPALVAARALQR
jgi:hypothetical protein